MTYGPLVDISVTSPRNAGNVNKFPRPYNSIHQYFAAILFCLKLRDFKYPSPCCTQSEYIHRMQIWRTTPSSPGTSCMKVRLVRPRCFVLTNASPEKSCFVDGLVCFISLCLRVFEFLNATRRE